MSYGNGYTKTVHPVMMSSVRNLLGSDMFDKINKR